jgi:hypothetical protein
MPEKPTLVMPVHDPDGVVVPHLEAIIPQLNDLCRCVYITLTPPTRDRHGDRLARLATDPFFRITYTPAGAPVGDQLRSLYAAAAASPPDQVLHLCFLDRVAYALGSEYRERFVADVRAATPEVTPLLYHRSEAAWRTHPCNYRELEGMATRVGELLFGRSLDLAWCHLAVRAGQLRQVLPQVRNHDLSILAEIVLPLREEVRVQEVDWLAWEDPFIYRRDPVELRTERERSPEETQKRLAYVLPILQLLCRRMNHHDLVCSLGSRAAC